MGEKKCHVVVVVVVGGEEVQGTNEEQVYGNIGNIFFICLWCLCVTLFQVVL